ncbi:MAG: hypothetical protein ABI222_03640 [Opitutaceae bacterium]
MVSARARCVTLLAKTDAINAVVLCGFGELLRPAAVPARSAQRQQLADLVQRREQLVTILAMEEQRLTQARDARVKKWESA